MVCNEMVEGGGLLKVKIKQLFCSDKFQSYILFLSLKSVISSPSSPKLLIGQMTMDNKIMWIQIVLKIISVFL